TAPTRTHRPSDDDRRRSPDAPIPPYPHAPLHPRALAVARAGRGGPPGRRPDRPGRGPAAAAGQCCRGKAARALRGGVALAAAGVRPRAHRRPLRTEERPGRKELTTRWAPRDRAL